MYLLDTNVLSELRKTDRRHPAVNVWAEMVAPEELWVSVVALGEIHQGIVQIRQRDPESASNLGNWLARLHQNFGERILPVTLDVAKEWGRLNAPRPLPAADSLMAATANVHGLIFVTRDVKGLAGTGVKLLNPFQG